MLISCTRVSLLRKVCSEDVCALSIGGSCLELSKKEVKVPLVWQYERLEKRVEGSRYLRTRQWNIVIVATTVVLIVVSAVLLALFLGGSWLRPLRGHRQRS